MRFGEERENFYIKTDKRFNLLKSKQGVEGDSAERIIAD